MDSKANTKQVALAHNNENEMGEFDEEPLSVLEVSYRRLRSAIMSGMFEPGEHLRQEDIASRFNISRGPAREALNRLAAEGFVTLRPRRGYIVAHLDVAEVEDIFDVRMILEEKAARLAAKRRTARDLKGVETILTQLEKLSLDETASIQEISELNRKFHAAVFECSGRKNLCKIISNLRDSVEHYVRLSFLGRPPPSNDHRDIYNALESGDETLIAKLSTRHSERICASIVKKIHNFEVKAPQVISKKQRSTSNGST